MLKMKPEDRLSFLEDIRKYSNAIAEEAKNIK